MRIVVIGSAGQLGRDLVPRLPGEVHALTRDRIDLTKPDPLRQTLAELKPEVVVNCAAYNFVDRAESEPDAAFAVNAWGVRHLALACRDLNARLIHFSTDYVFGLDQQRTTPYQPDDAPGPVSVYGLSKLTGEYLVRSLCPNHLVIRTCGLYGVWGSGGKGTNFVETMLRVAGQGKPLRVVNDQFCTPSYTVDVAEGTVALLKAGATGVAHLINAGSCSWYELAAQIFRTAGVGADSTPIPSRDYPTAARRPSYSVLAPTWPLRPWSEALAAYLIERQSKGTTNRLQ